jgi:hypothetical protein
LFHDFSSLNFGEGSFLLDLVKEFSTGAEFRDDVEVAVVLVELEDLDDVRVVLEWG